MKVDRISIDLTKYATILVKSINFGKNYLIPYLQDIFVY